MLAAIRVQTGDVRLLRCLQAWTEQPADGAHPGDGRGPSNRRARTRVLPPWMQPRTAWAGVSRQADIDAFSSVATFTEHAEGGLASCDVRQRAEPEGAQLAASAANKIFSLWPRRLSA